MQWRCPFQLVEISILLVLVPAGEIFLFLRGVHVQLDALAADSLTHSSAVRQWFEVDAQSCLEIWKYRQLIEH